MRRRITGVAGLIALSAGVALAPIAWSQAPSASQTPEAAAVADLITPADLARQGAEQLQKAKASAGGTSGVTLAKYPGHYTMITARTKSGGAEVHQYFSDFLIVVDGEGTELTGGTVVEPKQSANGETHGLRLEGATSHPLHKGDIIHITAGTPHQAIEAPGQTITIFVIKAETPAAMASEAAAAK